MFKIFSISESHLQNMRASFKLHFDTFDAWKAFYIEFDEAWLMPSDIEAFVYKTEGQATSFLFPTQLFSWLLNEAISPLII